jgi:hypothetical protein
MDLLLGGLNYQIEHHLFPSMPRPNLRHAHPLVVELRAERGIRYTETELHTSYRLVLSHLSGVAAGADGTRGSDAVRAGLVCRHPDHDSCSRPNASPAARHSSSPRQACPASGTGARGFARLHRRRPPSPHTGNHPLTLIRAVHVRAR